MSGGRGFAVGIALVLLPGAASAGPGWYLLEPPLYMVDDKGNRVDETWTVPPKIGFSAPLGEWEHRQSFDTAADCEAARRRGAEEAKRVLNDSVPGGWRAMSVEIRAKRTLSAQAHAARCIAANDPRLRVQQ